MSATLAVQQSAAQSIQSAVQSAVQSTPEQAHDIVSGSAIDREARGRALAEKFVNGLGTIVVKFIGDLKAEIIDVRQDFTVKPKGERICGVTTFTEYCIAVLGYSLRHIERVIAGHNPALSEEANADARNRKAKRQLNGRVKKLKNALPLRSRTNAEILADKKEEKKVDVLQKQVASLTHKLQATSTKPSPVSESQAKDLTKIHASEVKSLEDEIKKLKGSVEKLDAAYTTLRADAVRIAIVGTRVDSTNCSTMRSLSSKFLAKHGETVGGAA